MSSLNNKDMIAIKRDIGIPVAKVSPPNLDFLRQTVIRKELLEKIIVGINTPLTLISAGAGMGKTTLLTQVISHMSDHVAWLNLDEEDDSLLDFVYLLLFAIQKKQPHAGDALERYLTHYIGVKEDTHLLANLLVKVFEEIGSLGIIIDDVHLVSGNPQIIELLETVIERIPPETHIILSSRQQFPFQKLPQWRVQRRVYEITETDLLFQPAQIDQLLTLLELPQPHVEINLQLQRITSGWVGMIILLLRKISHTSGSVNWDYLLTKTEHQNQSMDYMIQEVINLLPAQHREFIIQTAILDRLRPGEVDEFLQREDSERILAQLSANNWLVSRYETEPPTYRYHHLLKECANSLLKIGLTPVAIQELHRRYGSFLETRGNVFEAIWQYKKANAFSEVIRLLSQIAEPEQDALSESRIMHSIVGIPESFFTDYPALILLKSKAEFLRNRVHTAIITADQAISGYLAIGDREGALSACWHKINIMQFEPRKTELETACRQALDIAGDVESLNRCYIELLWLRYFDASGSIEALRQLIQKSITLAKMQNHPVRIAREYANLATLYHMTLGEFEQAISIYEQQITVFENYSSIEQLSWCCFNLGICQFHTGELEKAIQTFKRVWLIGEEYDFKIYRIPSISFLASLYSETGKLDEAFALIQRLDELLREQSSSYATHNLVFAKISYYSAKGDARNAIDYAEQYYQLTVETESEALISQALVNKGEVFGRFRQWEAAEECLKKAIDYFIRMKRYYVVAYCYLHMALRLLDDPLEKSINYLVQALTLAQQHRFDMLFLTRPAYFNLLVYALCEKIEVEYVTRLFAMVRDPEILEPLLNHPEPRVQKAALLGLEAMDRLDAVMPRVQQLSQQGKLMVKTVARAIVSRKKVVDIVPLRIQCFKAFIVWVGDTEHRISDESWRIHRARKIFRYLLMHRNQPIHQEVLIEQFWPEIQLSKGINSLHNAMHCIRKALEYSRQPPIQYEYLLCRDRQYYLQLPQNSVVDYDLFQQFLAKTKTALEINNVLAARASFLRLAEIYIGELFPEDRYDDWVITLQQRCQTEFINCGLGLAGKLLKSGFALDAATIAERILNTDIGNEDAVAIAIKARTELGQRFRAIEAFKNFQESIRRNLQTEPSDYLYRLYQRIA